MAQLEGTENRISVERKRFNDGIRDYNLVIKRFPSSVIARLGGLMLAPILRRQKKRVLRQKLT